MTKLKEIIGIKKVILIGLGILIALGFWTHIFERMILPQVRKWPVLRNFSFLENNGSVVITKREEVRIQEGINEQDVVSKVKNSLVSVISYEGQRGTATVKISAIHSGVIITNNGIIAVPSELIAGAKSVAIVLQDGTVYDPSISAASDPFTGFSFLKINAVNLAAVSQGSSVNLPVGEPLLVIWPGENPAAPSLVPSLLSESAATNESLQRIYDLSHINLFLTTAEPFAVKSAGGIVANKDGTVVGFIGMSGGVAVGVRAEDMKLGINNYLANQKLSWPTLQLTYQILSPIQAEFLGFPKEDGILIKIAASPLKSGDLILAVDGRAVSHADGFQETLLSKKPGEKVKLKILRSGVEIEVEISL